MKSARIVVLGIAHVRRRRCRLSRKRLRPQGRLWSSRRHNCRRSMFWSRSRISRSGQSVGPDDVQWQTWPSATASSNFIRRSDRPDSDLPDHRIDRALALHRGRTDPRTEAGQGQRLRVHGGGIANRHARGFDRNFPRNRRRRLHPAQRPRRRDPVEATRRIWPTSCPDFIISEIILSNIRVLAIDQAPREKDGQNSVVGKTATLELKPAQAEMLARARQTGTLSLALRSMVDAHALEGAAR